MPPVKWHIERFLQLLSERGLNQTLDATQRYLASKIRDSRDKLYRPVFNQHYGYGLDVMAQDWDNLILLDAYRYDYFKEYSNFKGNLSCVVSRGNYSWEFIEKNFVGKEFHDTVYVTANAFSERLDDSTFYTIESLLDEWDSKIGTVHPEIVTQRAIEAADKFPNKRLIVHYMQPHEPFLGETGQKYTSATGGLNPLWAVDGVEESVDTGKRLTEMFMQGEVSKADLRQAYIENIEIVENHARELVEQLEGKTVISSDHGENLGESKLGLTYVEHINETPECRFVPWLELPCEERKEIVAEDPIGFRNTEDEVVQDRLADLGYL